MADPLLRKINVGRITGLSSYELAVKYGFVGTEEDYVKKEQELYDKMEKLSKSITCFNKISDGIDTIESTSSDTTLNIETDENITVELDKTTNTLRISLSDEFKDKIAYKSSTI